MLIVCVCVCLARMHVRVQVAADDTEDFDEVAKAQIPSQLPGYQVEYPSHISQSYQTSETNNSLGLSFTPLPSPHSLQRRSSSSSLRGADSLEGAFGLLLSSPGQKERMMPQRAESDGAGEPGGDDECLVSPFLSTSAPVAPPPSFDTPAAWRGEEREREGERERERERGSFAVRPRSSTRAAPSATCAAPSAVSASHRTIEVPGSVTLGQTLIGVTPIRMLTYAALHMLTLASSWYQPDQSDCCHSPSQTLVV